MHSRILRLNVGFLLKEGIGFSRDFTFEVPNVRLADDLVVTNLVGVVNFPRTPQGLYAQGTLQAQIPAECVRCLSPFEQAVSSQITELYHYPPENAPEGALKVDDDVHLDLTPLVREDMLLSMPMHALCRPDCKGLCAECGQNLNDGPCGCRPEALDPRLAPLQQLLKATPPPSD